MVRRGVYAGDAPNGVGLIFGELTGNEVDVAIWVAPESRKQGYGTAALKQARSELPRTSRARADRPHAGLGASHPCAFSVAGATKRRTVGGAAYAP